VQVAVHRLEVAAHGPGWVSPRARSRPRWFSAARTCSCHDCDNGSEFLGSRETTDDAKHWRGR